MLDSFKKFVDVFEGFLIQQILHGPARLKNAELQNHIDTEIDWFSALKIQGVWRYLVFHEDAFVSPMDAAFCSSLQRFGFGRRLGR